MAKVSHATAIVRVVAALIKDYGADLFHAGDGTAYLRAPVFDAEKQVTHYVTFGLTTDECRAYLRQMYYNATNGASVTAAAMKDAIETLAGSAASRSCHQVHIRLASFSDRVLIDLGSDDRAVIVVTAEGWDVRACPTDVRFVRPGGSGMLPLQRPVRSTESLMELIPRVLNISGETNILLLLAWWIVALRGCGPFLVLIFRGGSGSAKSNGLLIVRGVIDPNIASKNHLSRDKQDLAIAAANCYVASFDNVSVVPEDIADAICVLATGGGLRLRKLYTNNEEAIFSKKAPIVINGIPDVLARPDLAARAVVVELQPIAAEQRKTEREIDTIKQEVLPKILAGLLDVLVGVLQRESTTRPALLPRMADCAITLTAAEGSLALAPGTFIELLNQQADTAADAVIESNDELIPVLMQMTGDATEPWEGELKDVLRVMQLDEHGKPWTARRLGNSLRRLNDVLGRVGLRVVAPTSQSTAGPTRGKRLWRVEVTGQVQGAEPRQLDLGAKGAASDF